MDFKGHFALDGRTDGKGERCFPLTVLDDHSRYLLQGRRFLGFEADQAGLDIWRRHYNQDRPHEALDGAVPASRYLMSQRSPCDLGAGQPAGARLSRRRPRRPHPQERLPALCRPNGSPIDLQLSIAFAGQLAAVRPSATDGICHAWFSRYRIAEVDFTTNPDRPSVIHLFTHL